MVLRTLGNNPLASKICCADIKLPTSTYSPGDEKVDPEQCDPAGLPKFMMTKSPFLSQSKNHGLLGQNGANRITCKDSCLSICKKLGISQIGRCVYTRENPQWYPIASTPKVSYLVSRKKNLATLLLDAEAKKSTFGSP